MLLQNGVNLDKPNVAASKDALIYYVHFFKSDKDWDEKLPASTVAFARNKLAMYFGPSRSTDEIIKENGGFKFRTVTLPQLPKERPGDPDITYATYWAQAVWKKSNNSELAWSYLKFMSSTESLQSLNRERRSLNRTEKPYPRQEMAIIHKDDKILGSVIELAPQAKSWYLYQKTNDGLTGINSQISKLYVEALESAMGKGDLENSVKSLPAKVNAILAKYSSKK
jgi:ABC-type glycerol-3-phosphate transport system substrate-binding protein